MSKIRKYFDIRYWNIVENTKMGLEIKERVWPNQIKLQNSKVMNNEPRRAPTVIIRSLGVSHDRTLIYMYIYIVLAE